MNVTPPPKSAPTDSAKTIWVFTPSRTDPKDLEFILVQRQKLLQDAVERVKESALTDHKHHLLFVGPRGCGKTHLVTLIVNRLSVDEELTDRLRIAWLNEDETCTSLLELLLKIHSALEKRYPAEFTSEMLAPAYDLKQVDAQSFVSRHLLSALSSRTLLVVTENLDAIFEGLGDTGQKQLRSFIQENPRLSIVATAQRLVDDLSSRNSPFFGFFQTEHLKPLTIEQATELLQNIARLKGSDDLVAFLATGRGRARVRAIHHLSGGNHRIYIVLSQFITRDSVDALLEPFMKMVDELTPYYQERIRWLPPMQRKIVEYLCMCEDTVPVKEIAKRLFATPQTISSQLQDLREKGYVEANQRGRESLYEISEPLMRLCVEVKDNQRLQPLRLLVDFLRVWYEDRELKERLAQMEPASAGCAYVSSAILRNLVEGSLRKKILLEDFQSSLPKKLSAASRESLIEDMKELPEAILLALEFIRDGNPAEAIRDLNEAIAAESGPNKKAELLFYLAEVHSVFGNSEDEIADYTEIVELIGSSIEQKSKALLNRGLVHGQAGDDQQEIADYTTVVELPAAPAMHVAKALRIRGIVYARKGDMQRAKSDFEALINLPIARGIIVINAYLDLAQLYFTEARWHEGLEAIKASLDHGDEPQVAYRGPVADLIDLIFFGGLAPEGRSEKVSELVRIYANHQALPTLGDAVAQHVGRIFRAGEPFPSTDNLEGWASAWEKAAEGWPDFRLSVRLLRTGIDFVKAGGKDPGVLLTLISPEREILRKALGLANEDKQSRRIR